MAGQAPRREDKSVPILECTECASTSSGRAEGWRGYLVESDRDGRDETVFFCPGCASREFGELTSRRRETGVKERKARA